MLRTLALVASLFPALSFAIVPEARGPLPGTRRAVNTGPGDQTDPHVSGPLVAYTNEARGTSEIRYHDLRTGTDAAIPNNGAFDFVSDVSGNTVVFTRVSTASAIYTFQVGAESSPVEVAPEPGSSRRAAVIGGRTVAWQDFGYTGNTLQPEIAAYDLDRHILTRLTTDGLQDRTPAVSPDGRTVVWAKCDAQGLSCDIWEARWTGSGFATQALTGAEGEESQPDTNGQVVVYASTRMVDGVMERDIYWKPVGGGAEQRLELAGTDSNPSISGSLVAFERRAPDRGDFDIYLHDMETQALYALTQGPENENLTDLSMEPDGTVRVVWTAAESGDFNVHSFTFRLPDAPQCVPPTKEGRLPIDVCVDPQGWPLLTSTRVVRSTGNPNGVSLDFKGSGVGVLCVDNGHEAPRATSGRVWLNEHEKVNPSHFKDDDALIAVGVVMDGENGTNTLTATISGNPGSAYRIRMYGAPPVCEESEPAPVAPVFPPVEAVSSMTFVPEGRNVGPGPGGCSSTGGGSLALVGMMVLALGLARPRRAVVIARKELRRGGRAL
ncbi:hypothetical protein HPC49_07600 [Pyxidicoccus fallax]|uniref:Uncharacterized protein n=1 Tax=Pyxidicoccus fallax TaxID=394095 RepID=A0A848LB50_9BACT|nr:PD40 domain-containing protein [Pyxidicoccus fallax]NMO14075.1 hypothetical protein [Pyxidicoccus fallax]NPC78117.1 hypothetical protein [Pyxidicoccus fallax]